MRDEAVPLSLIVVGDRAGFEVGTEPSHRLRAAPHLVMERSEATAVVLVATGPAIEDWRSRGTARHVASFDPRSPSQRRLQDRLREETKRALRDLGRRSLADQIDTGLLPAIFRASVDPRVPRAVVDDMEQILELGVPIAVFVGPTEILE